MYFTCARSCWNISRHKYIALELNTVSVYLQLDIIHKLFVSLAVGCNEIVYVLSTA